MTAMMRFLRTGVGVGTPCYSLSILFLMNESLMFYLRQEILKLIGKEEAYRYVNAFGMVPKSPVFGKYNVSDYL